MDRSGNFQNKGGRGPVLRTVAFALGCLITVLAVMPKKVFAISDYCNRVFYNIETAETVGQSFHLKGWAYDIYGKDQSLNVHIYCGTGSDGSSDPHGFSTNVNRPDVNAAFGLSGNHGFDIWFATKETGSFRVMAYTFFTDGTPVPIYDQMVQYHKESKVSYDANGGSGAPAAQTKIYGSILTLSSTCPVRTGYTFQGWSKTRNGTVTYQPGGLYGADEAITLYAVWKANTYTVSYDANGGSNAPASQTKTYGSALTLSAQKPAHDGYDFQGWASSSGGSVEYQPGGTYTSESNVTLYAIWKLKTYTVTYDANGGEGAPADQVKTHGTALSISDAVPEREGYTFEGWVTDDEIRYMPGESYTEEASVSLKADWEQIKYSVIYDANGGSNAPESQEKIYGTELVLSSDVPEREDYIFLGWSTSADDVSAEYQPGDSYEEEKELTLYALWEQDRLPGDVNGDGNVDGKDALRLLRYMADVPVNIVEKNADVTGDGVVNGKDTLRLLKYFAEWDVVLE